MTRDNCLSRAHFRCPIDKKYSNQLFSSHLFQPTLIIGNNLSQTFQLVSNGKSDGVYLPMYTQVVTVAQNYVYLQWPDNAAQNNTWLVSIHRVHYTTHMY